MSSPIAIDMLLGRSEFNALAFQEADFLSVDDRPIAELANVQCNAVVCEAPG
jgi:hypothetical protein